MLDEKRLRTRLPISGLGEPLYFYRSIGSTNDRAIELAMEGAEQGTLVVTREQTAGRSRGDRPWFSKAGASLTFSVVLRPALSEHNLTAGLPVLGALAVVDALETIGVLGQIKWPNDVLIDNLKVAGILVEASWVADVLEYAILGIGVNLKKSAVPKKELEYPATFVNQYAQRRYKDEDLLVSILEALGKWHGRLGSKEIIMAWHHALAFRDKIVVLQGEGIQIIGKIKDLLPDGRLQVQTDDGEIFSAGTAELRLRPVDMPAS